MTVGTLYPPILDTMQPAFINTGECKVYFNINSLNTIDQYNDKLVQIKVTDNRTGKNVLREDLYPNAIKFVSLQEENSQYFIAFTANDLNFKSFPIDNYYKVQIRFTAREVSIEGADPINSQWFVDNVANFSAWSNACLVRAIDQPIIQINNLTATENIIKTENFSFVGTLSFNDQNELDSLASYRIRLYNAQNNLLENSGLLSPESNNTFNYNIKKTLNHGEEFNIKLNYTTSYGYTEELNYKIIVQILFNSIEGLAESTIAAEAIPELGAIRLSIVLKDAIPTMRKIGQIKIFRAELKDRYNTWTLIYEINEAFSMLNQFLYQWDDIITESSEGYKYKVQVFDDNGYRYELKSNGEMEIEKPVLLILDDMFLVSNGISLRIRYNPSISNFKRTLSESIVNTIGSKYPFVKRNGHMDYKTFSIGGLLSCNTEAELSQTLGTTTCFDSQSTVIDQDSIIDTRYSNSLFMRNTADYKKSFEGLSNSDIEIIYEKIFRDKVMDFLYDNGVKLFKSATEGNILVKLTNVSFTPNQQLGRRIYSFTAQATEIDAATYENYKKYGIFESETCDIEATLNILSAPYITETGEVKINSAEINYTEVASSNNIIDTLYLTSERGE